MRSRTQSARRSKKAFISGECTIRTPSENSISITADASTIPVAHAGASLPDNRPTASRKTSIHRVPSLRKSLPVVSKSMMYLVTVAERLPFRLQDHRLGLALSPRCFAIAI
ncbi:MAG: hypothetical protein OXC82_02665 [Rhodobacteraceae bacterium]|nr:hypothetical protein [Paracoccaceae bacterium]